MRPLTIIDQLLEEPQEVQAGLVNVWSVLPYQDPFWAATLETIGRLLGLIGLTPNLIYGQGQGIQSVQRIPAAQFNLLLTPAMMAAILARKRGWLKHG